MVYGEQLQTVWQLGNRVRLSAYGSFYDWKFADSIALSLLTANSASPADALLALSNTGEQNSIATVTVTNPVTGAKTITSAQFASKFGVLDSLAQLDIRTPSERWPLTFIGDFAENTRACENVKNIPAGAVLPAPCDPHARHGYWLETSIGRTLKKGDWQFSYTRIVAQREAVIGAFNYSEIFPTSNVEIHRPEILYQLFDNVTLQLNGLVWPSAGDRRKPAAAAVGTIAVRHDLQILGGQLEPWTTARKKMKTVFALLAALALIVALMTAPGIRAQQKPVVVRVGYFTNITHAQALVGRAGGQFEKALGSGVQIEWKAFNAGPAAIEALFANAIDLAYVGPNPTVTGYVRSQGAAVRLIAGAASGGAALVVRQAAGIQKAADFHGKKSRDPATGQHAGRRAAILAAGQRTEAARKGRRRSDSCRLPMPTSSRCFSRDSSTRRGRPNRGPRASCTKRAAGFFSTSAICGRIASS